MQFELQPIIDQIELFLPRLISAIVLILLAWIIASVLRAVVRRVLEAVRLDERLSRRDRVSAVHTTAEPPRTSLAKTLSEIVYWLVILAFLPAILSTLGLFGLLEPVQNMVDRILSFLPNLFAAGFIAFIGYLVARVVQNLVTNILSAIGVDRLGERMGLSSQAGAQRLSSVLGLVVFVLIMIPVLTAALNTLGLEAVAQPISNMLNTILLAVPNIFAAAALLVIAYVVARLVSGLVSSLLSAVGFNSILGRLGLARADAAVRRAMTKADQLRLAPDGTATPEAAIQSAPRSPADFVGYIVFAAIMLFASIEAARLLGFLGLAELLSAFAVLAGRVLMGLIILAAGLWLANLAGDAIESSEAANSGLLSQVARGAVLVLAIAMALSQMGLAPEIINLAFGLTLGAIAVAVALAFGLGGRETARRLTEEWAAQARAGEMTPRATSAPPAPDRTENV